MVAQPSLIPATPGNLRRFRADVASRMIGRSSEAALLTLGVLLGEHVLFVGPPGTGKSMLVQTVAQYFGGAVFDILMQRHTTPAEIFGPVSLKAMQDRDVRVLNITNTLLAAEFAFLDEIWKSNSAILNGLLRVTNEGTYVDGDGVHDCPVWTIVGASNEWAQEACLQALNDRFLLRSLVGYVSDTDFRVLMETASKNQWRARQMDGVLDLDDLRTRAQDEIEAVNADVAVEALCYLRPTLAAKGVEVSDRRFTKCIRLLKGAAWLDGRDKVAIQDVQWLKASLWTQEEQKAYVERAVDQYVGKEIGVMESVLVDLTARIDAAETQVWAGTISKADFLETLTKLATDAEQLEEQFALPVLAAIEARRVDQGAPAAAPAVATPTGTVQDSADEVLREVANFVAQGRIPAGTKKALRAQLQSIGKRAQEAEDMDTVSLLGSVFKSLSGLEVY